MEKERRRLACRRCGWFEAKHAPGAVTDQIALRSIYCERTWSLGECPGYKEESEDEFEEVVERMKRISR